MGMTHQLADSLLEQSLYEILDVAKDAPLKSIRAGFRRCLLQCHPDLVKDQNLKERKQDEFYRVQLAYEILSNENSRMRYDEQVSRIESAHMHHGSAKPLKSAVLKDMDHLAEVLADEERRALAKSSRVISHISQRSSTDH